MRNFKTENAANLTDEEKETIESLLKYPSLEKVFDQNQPNNLAEIKRKMNATISELERVIRSGSKDEAEKATEIAAGYRVTLNFLNELENLRKNQSK